MNFSQLILFLSGFNVYLCVRQPNYFRKTPVVDILTTETSESTGSPDGKLQTTDMKNYPSIASQKLYYRQPKYYMKKPDVDVLKTETSESTEVPDGKLQTTNMKNYPSITSQKLSHDHKYFMKKPDVDVLKTETSASTEFPDGKLQTTDIKNYPSIASQKQTNNETTATEDNNGLPPDKQKEPAPEDTFVVRDENGKICIMAKFEAKFALKYETTSGEQILNTEMPEKVKQKGTCDNSIDARSLELSWPKFMFRFRFKRGNKCSKDIVKKCWAVTDMTLSYNVTAEIFLDATKPQSRTIRSDDTIVYFESPKNKAYTCPSPEVVPLFNSANDERGTVRFTHMKIQPFDVIKGDFSTGSRCDQVSYGFGPEPYVDKTVPIAAGSTLAVLTLLCIIGYAIKRSIHERRVQYSNME